MNINLTINQNIVKAVIFLVLLVFPMIFALNVMKVIFYKTANVINVQIYIVKNV
jgi:hypothetical protein